MLESIEKLKRKITEKYGTHELPKPFAQGETIDETMGKAIANVDEMGVGGSSYHWTYEGGGDVSFTESADLSQIVPSSSRGEIWRLEFTLTNSTESDFSIEIHTSEEEAFYFSYVGENFYATLYAFYDDNNGIERNLGDITMYCDVGTASVNCKFYTLRNQDNSKVYLDSFLVFPTN